ncbi:MAG: helix-turn-helix domain-containing protein [Proteobacteria bacterium]|nr:helix-turn-helix domain-containing protein [Pseudomonadota bacterium]
MAIATNVYSKGSRQGEGVSPVPAACASSGCEFFERAAHNKPLGPVLKFDRNGTVYRRGETAHYCYKVLEGAVRISRVLVDGHRQILNFVLPGETFGIELADHYTADAEAVRGAMLLRCPRGCISHLAAHEPVQCQKLMAMLSDGMSAAQDHVILLSQQSALERVAAFLLRLAANNSEDSGSGNARVIEVPMQRQDMADYLSLTLETTCRSLTELKNRHLVSIPNRRQIRIHSIGGLEALLAPQD